jgi:hypothetical protein
MKGSFLDFFLEADSADSGVFLLLLEDVVEELQVDSSCVDFKKIVESWEIFQCMT